MPNWIPKTRESFWVWRNDNTAREHVWEGKLWQVHRWLAGNVHPTKEAAEQWGKEQEGE